MTDHLSKRDAILEAALRLFAERGFHGTSVPDLASAAHVGAGTIYRHFESKEAVVNALYQHWKVALGQEVFATVGAEGSWRHRFRELFRGLVRFSKRHPGAIEFLDLHHHGGYLDEASQAIEAQSAMAFLMLVQAAQSEEVLVDVPPAALIGMVYGAFLGLLRAEKEGYVVLDDALIDAAEERAWSMIRR
jgi:AcrR family transcriptional regulator